MCVCIYICKGIYIYISPQEDMCSSVSKRSLQNICINVIHQVVLNHLELKCDHTAYLYVLVLPIQRSINRREGITSRWKV